MALRIIRLICIATVSVVTLSLCSCQRIDGDVHASEESVTRGIVIETFLADTEAKPDGTESPDETNAFKQSEVTTDSSDVGVPVTEPFQTDFSTASETLGQSVNTDTSETQVVEPINEFSLPDEFYTRFNELVERWSLNPGCDNNPEECICNPEFEQTDADGNITRPRDRILSLYYRDVRSGFEFRYNEGVHYPVASTVKIPFCTLIYQKIEAGEIDPEAVLTYEERHFFHGSGVIANGQFGDQYTVQQLLTLAITRSDNVAYEMLKDLVTWDEFSEYMANAGCTHKEDIRKSKQKICVESAGAYGRILADYLSTDTPQVQTYKSDLLNTRIKMIVSDYPVYRKYGWAGFSFHDIAYVDAPRPYVLAVLTNFTGDDPGDYEIYEEISKLIEEFSQSDEE